MHDTREMTGRELRARVKALGQSYTFAAEQLGLTVDGLNKQMTGARRVSRQTEIILEYLEALCSGRLRPGRPRPQPAPD